MQLKVPIGYKFIFGFIAVVAAAAFAPAIIENTNITEWLKQPASVLFAMIIGLILGSVLTKGFTDRFSDLTRMAQKISDGDLTKDGDIVLDSKVIVDETDDLARSLITMRGNLKELVGHIQNTVDNLSETQEAFNAVITEGYSTSKKVVSSTSSIFEGALEQANHVGEAATTVLELAEHADEVAGKVRDSTNASSKVDSMVHKGATAATSAIEKMETIFKGIEKTESAALRLKDKVNDIPKVLEVITHISRQTDLLALNATIEASKAGEHGKGFAMVADEVRRFADNTNKSVDDVSLITKELSEEIERVVSSANEGTSFLNEGRDDIRKIRDILVEITEYTSEVSDRSNLILGLTHKQRDKAEGTADIIEEVAKIARDNLSSTEEVDRAVANHGKVMNETLEKSEKLSTLSGELKSIVERFQTN